MVFSSIIFLFIFLPILLFLYFLSADKYKNIILLIASFLFYSWGEPKNILLMLISIIVNYVFGIVIGKQKRAKKIVLAISIVYNLGILFVFKYLNFSVAIINKFAGTNLTIRQIALPIGISFFTFQIMSYVIDVYRENANMQKNILNLALYVALFPQLIAGPIVRYTDIEEQLKVRSITIGKIYYGLRRFAIGFSKKILIADQLSPFVDVIFTGQYSSIYGHWLGIIAYTLQIYFDFSGYSDMAIGLGKVLGFDFLENFNYPYISQSIQEFWRRWHISLSSWFKDYLYIPLGGSKCGQCRTYINLIIVFFMTGLWHGASFNFIVWGLFYVVFLIIERIGFRRILEKIPVFLRHIYALTVIIIGWVFFRADNLTEALQYIKSMFVPAGNDFANMSYTMNLQYWFCLVSGIYCAIPHLKTVNKMKESNIGNAILDLGVVIIFLIAICYMIGSGYSPFLYFRF